jgi:hypothetical protein
VNFTKTVLSEEVDIFRNRDHHFMERDTVLFFNL